jgi:hypothetical protein
VSGEERRGEERRGEGRKKKSVRVRVEWWEWRMCKADGTAKPVGKSAGSRTVRGRCPRGKECRSRWVQAAREQSSVVIPSHRVGALDGESEQRCCNTTITRSRHWTVVAVAQLTLIASMAYSTDSIRQYILPHVRSISGPELTLEETALRRCVSAANQTEGARRAICSGDGTDHSLLERRC